MSWQGTGLRKTQSHMGWLAAAVLLAGLWLFPAPARAQDALVTEAQLFEAFNGRLTTEVHIDGKGPFRFFLDTAASHSAIFQKTQKALGIQPTTEKRANVFTAFGSENLQLSEPVRLDAAGRALEGLNAVLLPDWTADSEPDGILGLDFLARYFVFVDVEDMNLTLADQRPKKLPGRWTSADMSPQALGEVGAPLYFVRMTMAGRRFIAIVDTGSISTVMNWSAALRMGIRPDNPNLRDGRMRDALGKQRPVIGVRFPNVEVGGKRWRNQDILVADLKIFEAFGRQNLPTAILGLDLLKKQNVAFDFKNERLYIAR